MFALGSLDICTWSDEEEPHQLQWAQFLLEKLCGGTEECGVQAQRRDEPHLPSMWEARPYLPHFQFVVDQITNKNVWKWVFYFWDAFGNDRCTTVESESFILVSSVVQGVAISLWDTRLRFFSGHWGLILILLLLFIPQSRELVFAKDCYCGHLVVGH